MFEYQTEGAAFLANGGTLLADSPGLGKSRQALLAAQTMGASTILVVCPAIAVGVWKVEAAKWRPDLITLTVREALKAGSLPRSNRLLIVSYDHLVATRSIYKKLSMPHDLLILDEAHALKNPTAKRTMLIYGAFCAGWPDSLVGQCGATKLLTGTPQLNHAGEWFTHLRALAPERIEQRSYDAFVNHYCTKKTRVVRTRGGREMPIEVIEGSNRATLPELAHRLRGFWLRRKTEDVLTALPPLRIVTRQLPIEALDATMLAKVEETPEAKDLVQALLAGDEDALRHFDEHLHLGRLRSLLALAKVDAVVAWAEGALDAGEPKVAIFGWHLEALEAIRAGLAAYNPVMIIGETPKRDEVVARFQTDQSCRVFAGQIQAAGTAITMTACRRVLMAEQAWTPALNLQAIKRCHRLGSTNAVLAEILVAPGLDEMVGGVLARKLNDIEALETENA